jgi:hypothetical protein
MKRNIKNIIIILLVFSSQLVLQKAKATDEEKPKEEAVKVTDAKLKLSFDTTGGKHIIATVTGKDATGAEVPVKDVTLKIFIKKSFGNLAIESDNMATDDAGTVTVEFPKEMPGDKDGIVQVGSKVEDDAKVGDLEAETAINWGKPTHIENTLNKRALWAAGSNAPIPLVIAVTSMIILVWGTIFSIVFKLVTINRLGKNENAIKS